MRALFFYVSLLLNFLAVAQHHLPAPGEVFRSDVVPEVHITMNNDSLTELLKWGNRFSDHHYPADFVFSNGSITDSIRNIGFRLRGNTSRSAQKKSFKISFNTFESGRKFYGIEKMNLNGEHNDPSLVRSKVCFDFLKYLEVPSSRVNHVRLYVNGDFFGFYANVEHIDEEFTKNRFGGDGNLYKCLYGANLYYLGPATSNYKKDYYELHKETAGGYTDLAHFIDVLNNTPDANFECELEKVFNVNSYIKSLVMDVLVGNWDGPNYNKNNFYLYFNPSTRLFEYIPYDLDNTLGVDFLGSNWSNRNIYSWSKNGSHRPLYQKILSRQKYKDYYSYLMEKSIQEYFNADSLGAELNRIRLLIRPYILNDTMRSKDYGYTVSDFDNSFGYFSKDHVKYGILDYITRREQSALSQLQSVPSQGPIVFWENSHVNYSSDVLELGLRPASSVGMKYVVVEYNWEAQSAIWYDTLAQDMSGNYKTNIAWHPTLKSVSYRYQLVDSNDRTIYWPSCHSFERIKSRTDRYLYINELLAKNTEGMTDEEGEYEDWIELYYGGITTDNTQGVFITDDLDNPYKFPLPASTLLPSTFKLLWADDETDEGIFHLNFKLSKGGETIALFDEFGSLLDSLSYTNASNDISFGRKEDGQTPWVWFNEPTPFASNQGVSAVGTLQESNLIYPNPSAGVVHIKAGQMVEVRIFNSSGVLIQDWHPTKTINITGHVPGVYLLQLKEGDAISTEKLLILEGSN